MTVGVTLDRRQGQRYARRMGPKTLNRAAVGLAVLWLGAYGCGGDDSGGDTSGRGGTSGHAGAGRGGTTAGQGGKSGSAGTVNGKGGTGGARAGSGGTAGDHSVAGESGNGGQSNADGGSSARGGRGGASGHDGSENTSGAGAGGENAAGKTGNAGAGGEGGAGPAPQMVTSLGCFAVSGDGFDQFASGGPATLVTAYTDVYCGGRLLSDNPDAFAPEFPPSTIRMVREFVIDDSLLSTASFSLSYRADDAGQFTLNGQSVSTCTPSTPTNGECSSGCTTASIPNEVLLGDGQVNRLEIVLTNLDSVDAGNGNFGYTDLAYSLCASD